jgi:hypothetical protein
LNVSFFFNIRKFNFTLRISSKEKLVPNGQPTPDMPLFEHALCNLVQNILRDIITPSDLSLVHTSFITTQNRSM